MTTSCRSLYVLALLGLSLANGTLDAQTTADSTRPHQGSWAAEASYGDGSGASLLYFSSPSAAWLISGRFVIGKETQDQNEPFGGVTSITDTRANVLVQLGRRWWSAEPSARLRPFSGLGVIGLYSSQSGSRSSGGGAYGELGATYFFSPHMSLGAAGELDLTASNGRFDSGSLTELKMRSWEFTGSLVHLTATVYF
jgi:hypothetical protein